jgi:hypothetical protein
MLKNNKILLFAITLFWVFLNFFSWQAWFEKFETFRFLFAMFIYLTPGILTFLLLSEDKIISLRLLMGGFAISLFATGVFGVIARVFQLNFTFIMWAFALWGIIIFYLYSNKPIQIHFDFDKPTWWEAVLLLLTFSAVMYFASLVRQPVIHDDAFTYNALLFYYQHAPQINFDMPDALSNLETPRFWLAFWPLAEAMISELSAIDGLLITGYYLPPLLAVFSFTGVYVLARTLGLSRILACIAIIAQGFGLMRLTLASQSGRLFFSRMTEDKVVAAFVVSLILLTLVVEYLSNPNNRKLVLMWLVAWAMAFTHPVQFGMICMIIGLYGLPAIFKTETRSKYIIMIVLLAVIAVVPYFSRFVEGENAQTLSFSLEDIEENDEYFRLRSNRIVIIEGTQFYGLDPYLVSALPYRIGALAAVVSLFFFWRDKAARYILAAFLVLGMAYLPYTGWMVGMFTTPYQLWRLTWLMPLGIAFAFLVWVGIDFIYKIKWFDLKKNWLNPLLYASVIGFLFASIFYIRAWTTENLFTGNINVHDFYTNYVNTARMMNALDVEDGAVIIGAPDAATHGIIPSLTLKYVPLVFRVESGGNNTQVWNSLIGDDISPDVRLERLKENNVQYLLVKGDLEWLQVFLNEYPNNIKFLFKDQRLSLYKLTY